MFEPVIQDGLVYELLDKNNLDGAIDCVSKVFTTAEPLAHHLKISYEEFLVFARAYYPKVAADGLSFVARDRQSGRVVGIRVSEDYVQEEAPDLDHISPKFFAIFTLLDQLSDHFKKIRRVEPGKYIHLFMVAVDEAYTNRGIAPTMNRFFFNYVKTLGFTHAATEPTGRISQHVLRDKFGFKELHRIYYKDYEFDGEKVFADIQGHDCAMLMEQSLSELGG